MNMNHLMEKVKQGPNYDKVGMILCHNGVVRGTSRDGRQVTGLHLTVDHGKLETILASARKRPGITDVMIEIAEDRDLAVGDDVMFLVVAGDIRENVLSTLSDTLNEVKATVTSKTEFFK